MGILLACLTALMFSISNVAIKRGMKNSTTDNGVLLTFLINFIFLGIAAFIYRFFIETVAITITGVFYFILAGFLTTFIGRFTLFKSFRRIGATKGTAIKNSAPLFTIVFALIFLNESLSFVPTIGISFVLIGLFIQGYFLVSYGNHELTKIQLNDRRGYLLALTAAVAFGIGQGVRKVGIESLPDPYLGAFISAVVAILMMLMIEGRKENVIKKLKTQVLRPNLYYVIGGVATSMAMLLFFMAIQFIQLSYVAAIAAIEPLVTIILMKAFLKGEETVARYTIISASIVFFGVTMIVLFI